MLLSRVSFRVRKAFFHFGYFLYRLFVTRIRHHTAEQDTHFNDGLNDSRPVIVSF